MSGAAKVTDNHFHIPAQFFSSAMVRNRLSSVRSATAATRRGQRNVCIGDIMYYRRFNVESTGTKVRPGLRVTLRKMHPMKTAMMPKKIQPEMERSTLLFRTRTNTHNERRRDTNVTVILQWLLRRFLVLSSSLTLEYAGLSTRTPLQVYVLCSGSSSGVTVCFSEGGKLIWFSSLNLFGRSGF